MQEAKPNQTNKIIVSYAQDVEGEDWVRLGHLPPEQKVAIMMDMTSACMRVCADGIRAQNPNINAEELLAKLRERLDFSKRDRLHEE
ncbi:MAG: hypothetical protein NWF00_01605 [Candidatus Bathyarchaeota archaeon]|nr:hypothetical protein [Candidatus Bathyarchaeota archaeon]